MVIPGMRITKVLPLTPENFKKTQGQAYAYVNDSIICLCTPTKEGENDSVSLDSQEGCYDDKYDAMVSD